MINTILSFKGINHLLFALNISILYDIYFAEVAETVL